MINIGCHLSSAKGYESMGLDALSIGANTFAFFTRNPRGGKAKDINEIDVEKFLKLASDNHFAQLVAHAPYTLNACSADKKTRDFAEMIFADDMLRMEYTPGNYYNFHPGSHVGQGIDVGINMIAEMLNRLITPEQTTIVLLETMSGKGSEVGSKFEELKAIIDKVTLTEKIGVCLDTCHVSDAGYDIIDDLDGVLDEFDRVIGLNMLKALHINDSMNPKGSHKDRHAPIGEGYLGVEVIRKVVNNPRLKGLPCILETPHDNLDGYKKEIEILRKEDK